MANRIIVLTGGIGSGKSEAAKIFEQLGITVVDADAISHALTGKGGAAISAIRQALGDEAIDAQGAMERAYIRKAAFSNPQTRKTLESILHPMIAAHASQALLQASGPYAVYAAPLWMEIHQPKGACAEDSASQPGPSLGMKPDAIVAVDCDDETRIERVAKRSGLPREQILAIMASQVSRKDRLAAADVVLDNSQSLEQLAQQVQALHQRLIRP